MDRDFLVLKYGEPDVENLTNGQVLKIHKDTAKMPSITSAQWLLSWVGLADSVSAPVLRAKIYRTMKKAAKCRGSKGDVLDNFNNEIFIFPSRPSPSSEIDNSHQQPSTSQDIITTSTTHQQPSTSQVHPLIRKRLTPMKTLNSTHHQLSMNKRNISTQKNKLRRLKDQIAKLKCMDEGKNPHYSLKNVKRREERNLAIRIKLRRENHRKDMIAEQASREIEQLNKKLSEKDLKMKQLTRKLKTQRRKTVIEKTEKLTWKRKAKYHGERRLKDRDKQCMEENVLEEDGQQVVETKNRGGEYTDQMRFCVMELAGLDVATGKVGPVIETVGELCGLKFSDVPSRQACQGMMDEGQVLAKNYIRDRVNRCKVFGLHKDGTTRKKVKILDTSLQTDAGDTFCLGWSSVVSETGQAIADEAKEKLEELTEEGESLKDIVQKMEYFMNDRAANEKKSSRLLEEWRDKYLNDCGEEERKRVHHLYCSAHVLLGFHTYVMNEIKKLYESNDYKHPVVVLLKDASDLFGPVGDYRGVRNQWEAYCTERKIKSTIKAYKDNRFNGLFEVSAQVFYHHHDFLNILTSLKSKNAKQTRLTTYLQNSKLILILECLGLFFHKVTGPFWSIVISSKSSYHHLTGAVQNLKQSAEKCLDDPAYLFDPDSFSFFRYPTSSPETKDSLSKKLKTEMATIISSVSRGILLTLEKQMSDFFEGGTYMDTTSVASIPASAPLTNLVCERHFGHLDASQRRRPHCSLHHHSSVILLKQTRKRLKVWYESLPDSKKEGMWKKARKEGGKLRRKHQQHDRKAVMDSLHTLKLRPIEVDCGELKEGQMIAVACEDAWYPALVETDSNEGQEVKVNFAQLGKGLGAFHWPNGKDVHMVSRRSVVETALDVEPRQGGRLWIVINADDVQRKFKLI